VKVIHIPYSFPPDPFGGTEVYVANLARLLQDRGIETLVCAPGETPTAYRYGELRVRRWTGTGVVDDAAYAYDEGDAIGCAQFERIVDEESPDIVHFHSFTAMASLRLARRLVERGVRVTFTYHVPTVSCLRGAMLLWGSVPCDGRLLVERCTACTAHGKGVPRALAQALGRIPVRIGEAVQDAKLSGGAWTGLRLTRLVKMRHDSVRSFLALADRIVAPSPWVTEMLVANGVPIEKVLACPQGVAVAGGTVPPPAAERRGGGLSMAFLGRLDPTKGVDVLLDALALIPGVDASLDIYPVLPRRNNPYAAAILARIAKDPRVRLLPAVASDAAVAAMQRYHLVAVPSQWLETGPLVVLEAFAAGVPVLGSNLGGIADRVRHGVDGLLLDPRRPVEWAESIRRLAEQPASLRALKAGVRAPRTMDEVCASMIEMYRDVLASRSEVRSPAGLVPAPLAPAP